MAQTIKLKRSAVNGAVPLTSQVALGEVAINTFNGRVFIKKNNGAESIVELVTGGGTFLGLSDTTGNYSGNANKPVLVNPGETATSFGGNILVDGVTMESNVPTVSRKSLNDSTISENLFSQFGAFLGGFSRNGATGAYAWSTANAGGIIQTQVVLSQTSAGHASLSNGVGAYVAPVADTDLVTKKFVDDSLPSAFQGALLRNVANLTVTHNVATLVPWALSIYDTSSIFNAGANPTRLTVPAGVTRVRILGKAQFIANATGRRFAGVRKNGSAFTGMAEARQQGVSLDNNSLNLVTATVTVVPGDYFELSVFQNSGANLTLSASNNSWFSMEIVE